MDLNKRFNGMRLRRVRLDTAQHGCDGGTVATDDSVPTDGGAGVACACVEKIPIDNPTPVKMLNWGD